MRKYMKVLLSLRTAAISLRGNHSKMVRSKPIEGSVQRYFEAAKKLVGGVMDFFETERKVVFAPVFVMFMIFVFVFVCPAVIGLTRTNNSPWTMFSV